MVTIDIEIDDFLSNCDKHDIKEIIQALVEDGWLKPSCIESENNSPRGYDEQTFEEALDKLRGKWNVLSNEEEEKIINIAKRF